MCGWVWSVIFLKSIFADLSFSSKDSFNCNVCSFAFNYYYYNKNMLFITCTIITLAFSSMEFSSSLICVLSLLIVAAG